MQERVKQYTNVIYGHRDFANKSCPGKMFSLDILRSKVAKLFVERGFEIKESCYRTPLFWYDSAWRVWKAIVIHHSATKDGLVPDWEAIWRFHVVERKWTAIGYHAGVEQDKNGVWVCRQGRSLSLDGAHTKEKGMNEKAIGLILVGNYDEVVPPERGYDLLANMCWELFVLKIVVPKFSLSITPTNL